MEATLSAMGIVFAVAMGGIFGALVFIAVELSRVASAFVMRPQEAQRDPEADDLLCEVLDRYGCLHHVDEDGLFIRIEQYLERIIHE